MAQEHGVRDLAQRPENGTVEDPLEEACTVEDDTNCVLKNNQIPQISTP